MSKIYEVNPVRDARWHELLQRHPRASLSHTPGWLEALRRTYGYEPVAFTTCRPTSELTNGLALCRIDSWLTGRRIVSVPFSDHCEPLFDSTEESSAVIAHLQKRAYPEWKYLEVRPMNGTFKQTSEQSGLRPYKRYLLHRLDLRPEQKELFANLHKSSAQRRILHAQRVGVTERCGVSRVHLNDFYNLLVMTRRRHNLPPQPYNWFLNLRDCLGDALEIRLAYWRGTPVAAVLNLRFRDVVFHKYGCSDASYHHLGAIPLLLWRTIEEAKSLGIKVFDLGRTDEDNPSLIAFKNRWAHGPVSLVYWRWPSDTASRDRWKLSMAKQFFASMPESVVKAAGRLLYRHIG